MASMTAEPRLLEAMEDVARRLAGVSFVLGGSAMMACRGIPVQVGDLDLMVGAEARADVLQRIPHATTPPSDDVNYCSAWRLAFRARGMEVEAIGDFCYIDRGRRFAVPPVGSGDVVAGVELAAVAPWVVFYRTHNPEKAALLEPFTTAGEIERAAVSMAL